jgi:hypothetical protein
LSRLCDQLTVRFPSPDPREFIESDVLGCLTPEVNACFRTTNFSLVYDYRPFFIAARQLGLERRIRVDEGGPAVNLSDAILKWRNDATLRMFVECYTLCNIPQAQLAEDLRKIYGFDVNEADLTVFEELFVDKDYADGNCWLSYTKCVGDTEASFKRRLMNEPKDFVRWKLGVPVTLETERVIDRLISDAYFTERLLKHQAGDMGLGLKKEELARMKLERETIFKGLDRRLELKKLSVAEGTKANTDAAQEIQRIILEYVPNDFPTKMDVVGEQPLSLDDLKRENTSGESKPAGQQSKN